MKNEYSPERRVAVVTGASSGIGAATAVRLAHDGFAIVLNARRQDRLEEVAARVREAGSVAIVVAGDLRDEGVSRSIVEQAAGWGVLEVVVANAGVGYTGPFEEMTDEQIRQVLDVNVLGVMRIVRLAIPALRQSGAGRIVIVGSVLSRVTTPHNAVYCASKHAVVGFGDSLRMELRRDGIRVINVLPGYTDTEFFGAQLRRDARAIDAVKKFWFFHSADNVADVIARRIRNPRAEVVVGALNTAVVLLGTRCPMLLRFLVNTVDDLTQSHAAQAAHATTAADPTS